MSQRFIDNEVVGVAYDTFGHRHAPPHQIFMHISWSNNKSIAANISGEVKSHSHVVPYFCSALEGMSRRALRLFIFSIKAHLDPK
jgi:hypothetical protein